MRGDARDALIRRQHASTLLLRHRLGIALGIDRDGSGPHNPTERTLFLSYISDYSAARARGREGARARSTNLEFQRLNRTYD